MIILALVQVAQIWVTTADRSKLLNHEPDGAFGATAPAAATVVTVDDNKTYQQMIGVGASMTDASSYLIQNKLNATQREALLQELFGRANGGLGFSFTRIPMGASDFSIHDYSYDDMPRHETDSALAHFSIDPDRQHRLPVLKRALAINPRLEIMANPWSPPGWMKTTDSMIGGTLLPRFYEPFARYFVKFIQAYAAEGVPIYAISVQNEPHYWPRNYPGMIIGPEERAAVIGQYLGPELAKAGLHTFIWDWDHNWDLPGQPLGVLKDPIARQYVQGVAWHCYNGDVDAQSTVHDAYPDKDTWFTECSGGFWETEFANDLRWFVGTLVIGTTRNWARGVSLWNLALDEKRGPHYGGCATCRGVVTIDTVTGAVTRNVEYYALAHFSKFVRPGAHRIASTQPGGLATVAFKNADDGSIALIVLNTGSDARPFAVQWAGKSMMTSLPVGAAATIVWH